MGGNSNWIHYVYLRNIDWMKILPEIISHYQEGKMKGGGGGTILLVQGDPGSCIYSQARKIFQ
jgi:hypothetical protein